MPSFILACCLPSNSGQGVFFFVLVARRDWEIDHYLTSEDSKNTCCFLMNLKRWNDFQLFFASNLAQYFWIIEPWVGCDEILTELQSILADFFWTLVAHSVKHKACIFPNFLGHFPFTLVFSPSRSQSSSAVRWIWSEARVIWVKPWLHRSWQVTIPKQAHPPRPKVGPVGWIFGCFKDWWWTKLCQRNTRVILPNWCWAATLQTVSYSIKMFGTTENLPGEGMMYWGYVWKSKVPVLAINAGLPKPCTSGKAITTLLKRDHPWESAWVFSHFDGWFWGWVRNFWGRVDSPRCLCRPAYGW